MSPNKGNNPGMAHDAQQPPCPGAELILHQDFPRPARLPLQFGRRGRGRPQRYVNSVLVPINLLWVYLILSQLSSFSFTTWAPAQRSEVNSYHRLPGEQVLDMEVDASASLQQLIPRVFEALGPLRPLRLLLSDGRSWQEMSCRLEQLGAAGYPAIG